MEKDLVSGVLYEPISTSSTMLLVTIGENVGASAITAFFPTPPFYITVMPKAPTIGVANNLDSEIMKVTSVSHDQVGNAALTCTRAQRGTTAKTFESGSIVTVGVYAEDVCFIGGNQTEETEQPWINAASIIWSTMIDKIYPVGSIFMSATLSTAAAVGNALGGTWTAWGVGRVPVGVDTTQTEFDTVEETGGTKTHRHNFKIGFAQYYGSFIGDNLANQGAFKYSTNSYPPTFSNDGQITVLKNNGIVTGGSQVTEGIRGSTGDTDIASTLQPYITCYMYKRTA